MCTEGREASVGEKEERETGGGEEGKDRKTLGTDLDARGSPSPYPVVVRLFELDTETETELDPDPDELKSGIDPGEAEVDVIKGGNEEDGELDCEEVFAEGETEERRGK